MTRPDDSTDGSPDASTGDSPPGRALRDSPPGHALRDSPPEPGERLITRRSLLTTAGLMAGAAVATAAGIELTRPGTAGTPTASPSAQSTAVALASPTPTPSPTTEPTTAGGPTPTPPPPGPRMAFRSRPDLRPPVMLIRTPATSAAPGLLLLTPNNGDAEDGPAIYTDTGDLVWMRADDTLHIAGLHATNLHLIQYQGQPALAWWQGTVNGGIGDGEYVIVDPSYQEIARVKTPGGGADLHEFHVTPQGTALYFVDKPVPPPPDSPTPPPSSVLDCAIVEVDLATGERLFEWHAIDHIAMDETYLSPPKADAYAYDYLHANSIDVDTDGTLLVSARNTCAVYKVDRATGNIVWRLGGRRSDFTIGDGAAFGWQHDARRQPDGTLTLFDDEQPPTLGRGLVLRLDETGMTSTLVRSYERPEGLQISSQGNLQVLPNGNVMVGWGSQPVLTEFAADGTVVFDASLPAAKQSYRDFRSVWSGRPSTPPALALDRVVSVTSSQRRINAYASWNGATEVVAWRLLAGAKANRLAAVADTPRTGFETVISEVVDRKSAAFVAVAALDASGAVLATSKAMATG